MRYVDHHAHMVSRTTDDYQQMALTGCVAISEPAFWAGWDRTSPESFEDYFRQLTEFEPRRAAQFGIQHYTWIAMNPKEADDRALSRAVLERIPKYLDRPTVLGIGEIGLNRVTRNEVATFDEQVDLAVGRRQLILIHTPHLEDKLKGTRITLDVLANYRSAEPARVMVDHAEEHTVEMILERGCWTGLTLYPNTKVSPQRAVDIIEKHGPERICVAGACDWGVSDPLAVPKLIMEMRRRRHDEDLIRRVVYDNPVEFLSQSPNFSLRRSARADVHASRTGVD